MIMIQSEFLSSLREYSVPPDQCEKLWYEVAHAYTQAGRYYHTLHHLDHLLAELKPFQSQFHPWNTIVFAIVYHDAVYSVFKNNNEEKSAVLAANRLQRIGSPLTEIDYCKKLILATKTHEATEREVNYFIDADLAILGTTSHDYQRYASQVRNEFSVYPDFIYKNGRRKVLAHFLNKTRIYQSNEFFEKYESTARQNLLAELEELG